MKSRLARLDGFGRLHPGEAQLFSPTNLAELAEALSSPSGNVGTTLRGAGRSYGDASSPVGAVAVSLRRMNRILSWNAESGEVEAEGGATLEDIWRYTIEDGFWFNVVSGTMKPTLGGAIGTNIHGKNNPRSGTFAEHVSELDIMRPDGAVITLRPEDADFWSVCGGLGMLGVVTRVKFRLRPIASGNVRTVSLPVKSWSDHFELFAKYAEADYAVGWVNGFSQGHGTFQAAWHGTTPEPATLTTAYQDRGGRLLGMIPRDQAWRYLRLLTNRPGMSFASQMKEFAGTVLPGEKIMSLVQYNFQLDYLTEWERAYVPNGLLQFQCALPRAHAEDVFVRMNRQWIEQRLEPFLVVLKAHRPDTTTLRYLDDGFSVALDFRLTRSNRDALLRMYIQFAEMALKVGGRIYFAKDGYLPAELAQESLGREAVARFLETKERWDPEMRLRTQLSDRIGLTPKPVVQYGLTNSVDRERNLDRTTE